MQRSCFEFHEEFFSLVRKPQKRKTYAVQEDLTISPFTGFSFCTVSILFVFWCFVQLDSNMHYRNLPTAHHCHSGSTFQSEALDIEQGLISF